MTFDSHTFMMLAPLINCLQYPFPLPTARLIQTRSLLFSLAFQRVKVHTATIFVDAEDLATVVWYLPFCLKVVSVVLEFLSLNILVGFGLVVTAARFGRAETVNIKVPDFSNRMGARPFLDIKVWNASLERGRRVDESAFIHVY
jgi:hypothetical protein